MRRSYFHSRAAVKTGTRTGRDAKIVAEYVSTFHYYFYRANQSVKAIVRAKCPQRLLLEQGRCLSSKSRKSFPCVRCQSSIMCGSCRTEPNPTITPSQRQDTAFHPRCDVLPLASATPQLYAPHLSFFSRSSHFQLYSVFVNNPNYHSLVFTNELSKSLNRRTVYKHLKKILSSIVLDDCYFYTLRHTFATLSLQNGDDVLTVKENLGDHSAAFTLNTYGYLIQAMRRDSAKRMEKAVPNDCDRQKCVFVVRKIVPRKMFHVFAQNSKNRTLFFDKVR